MDVSHRQVTFEIAGMTCVSCEDHVRDALVRAGAHSVTVDHRRGIARFFWPLAAVTEADLRVAISAAGYGPGALELEAPGIRQPPLVSSNEEEAEEGASETPAHGSAHDGQPGEQADTHPQRGLDVDRTGAAEHPFRLDLEGSLHLGGISAAAPRNAQPARSSEQVEGTAFRSTQVSEDGAFRSTQVSEDTAFRITQVLEDGATLLRALTAPEHGKDYFFPTTASGQPLALAGFALTLGLLSLGNAEWINLRALGIVVPVALAYGGLALILAGFWDVRANNVFGATWSVSYGCFWISIALLIQVVGPQVAVVAGPSNYADAFGAYLLLWCIFSIYMTLSAYFVAKPAFLAFFLLTAVFFLLGLSNLLAPGDASDVLRRLGGYVGFACAGVAWYLSAALVINSTSGRELLPIWPYRRKQRSDMWRRGQSTAHRIRRRYEGLDRATRHP